MKVGDLVSPKHTKWAFGIVVKHVQTNMSERWLIQWSNQKRSYELEKNLEVISEGTIRR